jgi:hypothetical protein
VNDIEGTFTAPNIPQSQDGYNTASHKGLQSYNSFPTAQDAAPSSINGPASEALSPTTADSRPSPPESRPQLISQEDTGPQEAVIEDRTAPVIIPKDEGPQEATIEDRTAPVITPMDEGSQEAIIEDRITPIIIPKDQGSTIHPQKVKASRLHVAKIEDTPIRQKTSNLSDTSSLKHKHHENIRIKFQASSQDSKGSISKKPGAVKQQNVLGFLQGFQIILSILVIVLAAYTMNFFTGPYSTVPGAAMTVAGCSVCISVVRAPPGDLIPVPCKPLTKRRESLASSRPC